MSTPYHTKPVQDFLGKLLFPHLENAVRRKNVRALFLSVCLGLVVCIALGSMLLFLNKQGHM